MSDRINGRKMPVSSRAGFNPNSDVTLSLDLFAVITRIKCILFMGVDLPLKVSFHLD